MVFAAAAVERAMKIQEVIMRALSGTITWLQAADIGVEHMGAYSPQARGRSERLNRTVQGRLVNELALAGITTLSAANRYLSEHFTPDSKGRSGGT